MKSHDSGSSLMIKMNYKVGLQEPASPVLCLQRQISLFVEWFANNVALFTIAYTSLSD